MAEIYAFTFMIGFHLLTVAMIYPEHRRSGHQYIQTISLALLFVTGWHFTNAFLATAPVISFSGYVLGNTVLLISAVMILKACAQMSGRQLPKAMTPMVVAAFGLSVVAHYIIASDVTVRLLSLPAVFCLLTSAIVIVRQRTTPLWWLIATVLGLLVVMFNTIFMYLLYVAPEIARLSYFVMSFLLPIAGLLMLQSSLATTTREAKDSARAFREMFESVQEVFVRMDQHGTLVDVSPSISQFGYSREQLLGESLRVIYAVPSKFEQDINRLTQNKRIPHLPLKLKNADGETRDCEMSLNVVTNDHGGIRVFVGTIRDVDERNLLERQFLDAQRRESMGVLAGGIAHDFNNILQGIVGHADWLLHKPDMNAEDRKNHLEIILEASGTAAGLCRQLLEYTGRSHTDMAPVNLNVAVHDVLDITRHSIPEGIVIQDQTMAQPVIVVADATQLRQVIMNLIQNAIEAMNSNGNIRVNVRTDYLSQSQLDLVRPSEQALSPDQYAVVEIADSGCGMDEDAVERMFDPFYSTKSMGHGLGLAAVIGIVRSHAGGITVDSAPDRGTTIRVLLPLAQSQTLPDAQPTTTQPFGDRQLILVADDEQDIREVVTSLLEHNGYDVVTASDGNEAVAQFHRHESKIAAIIMDVKMPNKDGFTAVREIRASGSQVPVLVASGYREAMDDEVNAAVLGYRFIAKPYRREALLNALGAIVKQPPGQIPSKTDSR